MELDSEAGALFRQHYQSIYKLLFKLTGDAPAAEDLAVQVFLKYFRRPPQTTHPQGWLSRSAVWLGLDSMRKQSRQRRLQDAAPAPKPRSAEPDELVASRQPQERVRHVLARLKIEQAELLLLRNEGFTYGEIAVALDRKPNGVGTLLARAEEAFRKEYTKLYGSPEGLGTKVDCDA